MKAFDYLMDIRERKGAGFLLLLDPDKLANENLGNNLRLAEESGVDAFLVGSSLMTRDVFEQTLGRIKKYADVPVIIFPGSLFQISGQADAILFLSVLASKNVDLIIGNHVHAAPLIRQHDLETISTAYLLVESGKLTSAHFMSDSLPIPRDKPEIAAAYAVAAGMFGFKMVYLEAGSGATQHVPGEMVYMVSKTAGMPVIVGGGIKDAGSAHELVTSGASFIVTGNYFEKEGNTNKLSEFAKAIHFRQPVPTVV